MAFGHLLAIVAACTQSHPVPKLGLQGDSSAAAGACAGEACEDSAEADEHGPAKAGVARPTGPATATGQERAQGDPETSVAEDEPRDPARGGEAGAPTSSPARPAAPAGAASADETDEVSTELDDAADRFFAERRVHEIELQVGPEDLALIDSDPAAEVYISAELTMDGEPFGPVGLRYKGSVGAFLTPCTAATFPGMTTGPKVGKCSMKLDFDRVDPEQRLYGLKKLNLHSMGRDPSLLREHLGYGLYRQMGVASSRTTYANVVVNGELQGLFLGVEQVDGRFTRARFPDGGKGNLYKEIWPDSPNESEFREALETNEGEDTPVDSIMSFAQAVQDNPEGALTFLDRDYMLRYVAVDRLILNDDGVFHWYCFGSSRFDLGFGYNHNYYWYEATDRDQLWLIPWDLDISFGGLLRTRIDRDWRDASDCSCHVVEGVEQASPQRAPACDALTGEVARWLQDYEHAVDELLEGPLAAEQVDAQLMELADLIGPAVEQAARITGNPTVEAWQEGIQQLRMIIDHSRSTRGQWPGF